MEQKNSLRTKFESMVGKSWMINTKLATLMGYEVSDDHVIFITNKRNYKVDHDQAMKWLKDCLPVEQNEILPSILPKESIMTNEVSKTLKETLLENIKNIKITNNNIDQEIKKANAINKQVKTVLDMAKTEIAMANVILKSQQRK